MKKLVGLFEGQNVLYLHYIIVLLIIVAAVLVGHRQYKQELLSYFKDASAKKEVTTSEVVIDSSTMVVLAFGQSNSANHGNWKYASKKEVLNYYKGKFYKAEDPLLGASDVGGSVWCYLGDLLVEGGHYGNVIFITIGIGDTSAELWATGKCRKLLVSTLRELQKKGIKLTHILYHQGETDNTIGTKRVEYKGQLKKILNTIRTLKQEAPLFVSIATYNGSVNTEIQNAQKEFAKENESVFLGPNTDTIVSTVDRFDGIHFSETGAKKVAHAWFEAIIKKEK